MQRLDFVALAAVRPAVLTVLAVLSLCAARPAAAQLHFGASGGLALPQTEAKDVFKNGYQGAVMLELGVPLAPLRARIEASYLRFDTDLHSGSVLNGDARIFSGTGNVLFTLPLPLVKPYVIGGAGYYNLKVSVTGTGFGSSTETRGEFGWNAGAGVGLKLGKLAVFGEARYHRIRTEGADFVMVPVSVGVLF